MDMVWSLGLKGVSHSVWMAFSLPFQATKVRPATAFYIHYVDSGLMGIVSEFGSDERLS
jgi:hypothetical protein